jgi:HSP20 family molecular chaperone IbpA
VLFRNGVVIVAGEKAAVPTVPEAAYHLVERDFGRFARAVRLTGAFDVRRASATLRSGELTSFCRSCSSAAGGRTASR